MRNQCTVCGKQLELWERVWGRFDHASCRSMAQGHKAGSSFLCKSHPEQRVAQTPEEALEFSSAPHRLFTAAKEATYWQRSA